MWLECSKIVCAKYGYVIKPKVPNATTFATAYETSCGFALIAGATAVIAVTPHIEVPAAIKDDIRGGKPM